jgi:hypothetical protein
MVKRGFWKWKWKLVVVLERFKLDTIC